MTKEELKQEAEEYVCKRNPLVTKEWFIDAFKKYDKGEKVKYLKDCEIAEYEAYLAGAEPREKRIAELEAQIEKMSETLLDLLWFEGNLDPYMYECNEAQKGELLKPFTNAREYLKDYICKKCKGEGTVRVGYNGWDKNPCPACKGKGYIFRR